MKKMMYLYVNSDETLQNKVRLLRDNIYYLANAEKRSLIELAMQMLSRAYKETTQIVLKQYQKIDELLFVYRG